MTDTTALSAKMLEQLERMLTEANPTDPMVTAGLLFAIGACFLREIENPKARRAVMLAGHALIDKAAGMAPVDSGRGEE